MIYKASAAHPATAMCPWSPHPTLRQATEMARGTKPGTPQLLNKSCATGNVHSSEPFEPWNIVPKMAGPQECLSSSKQPTRCSWQLPSRPRPPHIDTPTLYNLNVHNFPSTPLDSRQHLPVSPPSCDMLKAFQRIWRSLMTVRSSPGKRHQSYSGQSWFNTCCFLVDD